LEAKAIIARGRSFIRPCSLAGSRWEPAAAGVFGAALGGVFGSEVLTPDDVVATLGLPPLLAALWTLSGRLAAAVAGFALALFGIVFVLEAANRPTLVAVGISGLVLAVAVRTSATNLKTAGAAMAVERPHPPTPHGVESLTRRELEVAALAAQGYTAGEIGAALHISERTVETHLAHVYGKLGVTSKRSLVRMGGSLARRSR
jgi:DNA-binding CsgD family transcriptional regulator